VIVLASAIGLLLDLGSWFPASVDERFVYLIVIGGWMFAGATGLGLLSVVVDAWIPGRIGVWKENS
jgi:hypothetical protein